ncbi:flagellar brake protein [Anaerobacillus alkalilacustris]|uniref:flagellar brake protein n=1 Tax=Anaerobacillus alkalilacustris TaxID=393763 RepID=UPI000A3F0FD9|nr:flagellar brake domain-containing protein [Anaerobacillus alkalilacustris]
MLDITNLEGSSSLLNIGDTIYLELEDDKDEIKKRFKCRLVDRVKEFLFIDYPIDERTKKVGFFHDGTQFRASFIGKDQAVYLFSTQLQGRQKGRIPMLIIRDPGKEKYIRIQRRQHVRVKASVSVAAHPENEEFTPFVTVTEDISGGGIALVLPRNHQLPAGQQIICWLSLHMQTGEIKYIKVTCFVIRIITSKNNAREKASIQFININEGDRQTIIRYCFERQLYLRKKGLLE